MKGKTRLLVVLVLAVALLTALVPATGFAKGNKTHFTGWECYVDTPDWGIWKDLGGGHVRIIGMLEESAGSTTDPRTTGDVYVDVNSVVDMVTGSGPMWGSWQIVNADGSWSGNFTGRLDNWGTVVHATARGSGAYEGLVGSWIYTSGEDPCDAIDGYIVETGGGKWPGMIHTLPRLSAPGMRSPRNGCQRAGLPQPAGGVDWPCPRTCQVRRSAPRTQRAERPGACPHRLPVIRRVVSPHEKWLSFEGQSP